MGEKLAAEYLSSKKGMRILKRNWRNGKNEIDIIALDGNRIVFVEVKTRNESALVDGFYSALKKSKRNALRKAANAYMRTIEKRGVHAEFDIVDVRIADNKKIPPVISHFKNVGI